jgi:hypothetical protein
MQAIVKCLLVSVKTVNWFYGRSMVAEFCLKMFSAYHGVYCCHPFTVHSSTERKSTLTRVHLFVLCNDAVIRVDYRRMHKYVVLV